MAPGVSVRSVEAQSFSTLHVFEDRPDGSESFANLISDRQGNLYGTTYVGGAFGAGTVFVVSPSGQEIVLHSFSGGADGGFPLAGLVRDGNGNLYGTTRSGGTFGNGTVFQLRGTTETVLYSFGVLPDGAQPDGTLLRDNAGNLYGTTVTGGNGTGTIFKLDPTGAETVLYTFCSRANCSDGATPVGGLVRDKAGNFYGTTSHGGTSGVLGYGTVFKFDTNDVETVLYSFTGQQDGAMPQAGLTIGVDGNLYGTTTYGGDANCDPGLGCGTVFAFTAKGGGRILHTFTGGDDGALPFGNLVQDPSLCLYGTAEINGASGYGTVFAICGKRFVVLHSFGNSDGAYPNAGLLRDANGNLSGTTAFGGDLNCGGGGGCGTVFKLVANPGKTKPAREPGTLTITLLPQ